MGSAGFLCVCAQAIVKAGVGIQVHLVHDPLLSDGALQSAGGVSGHCKLAVADGGTMRAELGSPEVRNIVR